MMANDWKRLNIWLRLDNRNNYAEFAAACKAEATEPQPILEFAQKSGMISTAMVAYPELPVAEAYLKLLKDNQQAFTPPTQQPQVTAPVAAPTGYKKEKVTITYSDGRTQEQEIMVADGKQGCCGGGAVR